MKWIPYVIAACLMLVGILQLRQIVALKAQLADARDDAAHLRESNAFAGLTLTTLDAKAAALDVAYVSSRIVVAWDPYEHRGVIATQNLPTPQAGQDYQLWVLDPAAEAPISAGVISGSRPFAVRPVSTSKPGFAVSLEPGGGSAFPTGPILFAVAPGS
jgi:anti-sigma-K factor RskA